MSQYLVDRIEAHPRVTSTSARRHRADGVPTLQRSPSPAPTVSSTSTARRCSRSSAPNPTVRGSTGSPSTSTASCSPTALDSTLGDAWCARSAPLPYETSRPGLFAVGDLRSGSTKRVAAAVGEGSAAIRSVHEHLALVVDA